MCGSECTRQYIQKHHGEGAMTVPDMDVRINDVELYLSQDALV
jgi:hypothetical protein